MRVCSFFFCILFLLPASLSCATWYIRPDGGTAAQCTGKADASYPGHGSHQACAFNDPFFLWTNDPPRSQRYETPQWKIAGGDTVLIKNGDYRMGYKTPDVNGWWNYLGCRGNNHGCYNPPVPAGADGAPTRIVGEGWQSGCKSKPILRGVGGTGAVLNLKGTSHVDIECIEFSDAAQCRLMTTKGEPYACVNYQSDDAYTAILTDRSTSYLTLRNLFIHGMASSGILGNIGGNVVAENLHLRGNGNFGWDFDPGGGAPSAGPLTIRNSIVEWSACVERYPLVDPVIVGCYDQAGANANGDGLGFVDLDGDITIDHTIVRYNQQDGLDALYVKSGRTLAVTNSEFYGNTGQEIKTGGASHTVIRNNLVVGNCERQREGVPGVTAENFNQYEKSWCRGQDMVALMFKNDTSVQFENNTLVGYSPTGFNLQCRRIDEVFNSAGRTGWDGSVNPQFAPDGKRRDFYTRSPIDSIAMTGAVYVYPKKGSRIPKRVGRVGTDKICYGSPCQFWYDPGTNHLYQDPADPPLQETDELRVDYAFAGYCSRISLSFKNNLVRGYPRRSTREDAGGFWIYNLKPGVFDGPGIWMNNIYCGMRAVPSRPQEKNFGSCPGNFFVAEPASLSSETDLDRLDPHLRPGSPAIDRGTAIPGLTTDHEGNRRPSGAAYDVGAFERSSGQH